MRYLYLHALSAMRFKSLAEADRVAGCTKSCLWNERSWPGFPDRKAWADFYRGTSDNRTSFCDCYRNTDPGVPCCTQIMENRYAHAAGTNFVYLQLWGRGELKGTWAPWGQHQDDALRSPHPSYAPTWTRKWSDLGAVVRPLLNSSGLAGGRSTLVLNMGLHLHDYVSRLQQCRSPHYRPAECAAIGREMAVFYVQLAAMVRGVADRVIWLTTIAQHQNPFTGPLVQMEQQVLAWTQPFPELFNTSAHVAPLNKSHFWDGIMHLGGPANEMLACHFLHQLRPALVSATGARWACGRHLRGR